MAATIKVTVHDMVVTEREVEIAVVCPSCGADFHEKPMTLWEFQDQYRSARRDPQEPEEWASLGLEAHDLEYGDPYQGETYLHISWTCGCGHVLAEAKESRS